jgi:hypothetical protein
VTSIGHLSRRFTGSLSTRPPPAEDTTWALEQLLRGEVGLWQEMTAQDRRHSVLVARRFVQCVPHASRAEVAAALLHDVGKTVSGLGTWSRVIATVVGPRTARFREYHDHERLGAEMLRAAGSDPATIELVQGRGPHGPALRDADDV